MERREFLKVTWYSGMLLSAAGITATLSGCSSPPATEQGFKVLRSEDVAFFNAILVACLPSVLSSDAAQTGTEQAQLREEIIFNFDRIMSLTNSAAKKQFQQLMDLLNMRLTRGLLTGVWQPWQNASPQEVENFLWRWRTSSLRILSVAYVLITTMVTMAAFQIPGIAAQVGYFGPPQELLVAWQHPYK